MFKASAANQSKQMTVLLVACIAFLIFCSHSIAAIQLKDHAIIPSPQLVVPKHGAFSITGDSRICVHGNDWATLEPAAQALLTEINHICNLNIAIEQQEDVEQCGIVLELNSQIAGAESYVIQIEQEKLLLQSSASIGMFYAMQTTRQLLFQHAHSRALPCGRIEDSPTHEWRGMMLDIARHFLPPSTIKRLIDIAAMYKINRLHLHLSDDQGWRLEIKSLPRLTLIGSQTQVGGGKGGYLLQEEYKDIVKYAAARFIEVIPEFDFPAHTHALIAAYPRLKGMRSRVPSWNTVPANGSPIPLYSGIEVGFSCVNLTSNILHKVIRRVFAEVAAITPGRYIHIGGDEADACPKGSEFASFIHKVSEAVRDVGKIPIGWQEAGSKGVDIQQYWWSSKDMGSAMKTILSPASKAYLDMKYSYSFNNLGLSWAGVTNLQDAYQWDAHEVANSTGRSLQVVGVEAALWTETISNEHDMFLMVLPRLPAIAEVGWTTKSGRGWESFAKRIRVHGKIWDSYGIPYYKTSNVNWDSGSVKASHRRQGKFPTAF